MTGGEAVVRALRAEGIDTLFGLPGIQNDWLYNALHDASGAIRVYHTRHEQGAAYMALGWALASGRIGTCSVVPGPGLLNASAALATAYGLGAPLLMLAGQIPSHLIGRDLGTLHEIPDQLAIMRSLTKWSERIESRAEVPHKIARAFAELRSGRPRPVGLEIPMDVLAARAEVDTAPLERPGPQAAFDVDDVERAAALLGSAARPMLFVGGGAQGVSAEVRELAEALEAPVVAYRTGRGVLDSRHHLSLVQPAARRLWETADVVMAIGSTMRVPLQSWPADPGRKLIRVDVDPSSHARIAPPTVAITARAEDALPSLIERLGRHNRVRSSRRDELDAARRDWEARSAVLEPQLRYLAVIREALGEDGIFVDELTQVGFASRIVMPVHRPRTFISTGYMGTLGYGFPTALGARAARPATRVLSVTGDGGFLFAVGELATAVQHRLGVVVVVFNNNQYGNVQQMQREVYGNRVIATDLHNPDFVALAESFGAQAFRARGPEGLARALDHAFDAAVPTVIEVPVGDMPSVDRFR